MQWWAEHLTNSLIHEKIKLRNLDTNYKNNNFGANEKHIGRMVKYLSKLIPWFKTSEANPDIKGLKEKCKELSAMVGLLKDKLNNFRFE